jgi:hemerythrin
MAKQFSQMFNFQHVISGYFLADKMPTFGQLGCSGFIVAEVGSGNVIHKATPAFLQHGPAAFGWVERMFRTLSPSLASLESTLPANAIRVQLTGLQSQPPMNGLKGYLIRKDESNPQRFVILLDNGDQVSLKSANFEELEDEENQHDQDKQGNVELKEGDDGTQGECSNDKDALSCLVLQKSPKLGFAQIDEEHEECDQALSQLVLRKTVITLYTFRNTLKRHFEHEEQMMQDADFGNAKQSAIDSNFSAYASHKADHNVILQLLDSVLQEYTVTKEAFVCKDSLLQIVQRFKMHIENYDTLYHDAFVVAGIE